MKDDRSSGELAEILGQKAGRLFKAIKPGLKRAFTDAKPLLERTGRQATHYAREHDAEIKQSAAKVARARLAWPFGFLVDAVTSRADDQGQNLGDCPSCHSANPQNAKFCNQCGSSILQPP
jgi:hypothetical protein